MSNNLSPDDLAALYGPCDRAAEQHRIVIESHACDTCNAWGEIYIEGHWVICLPCGGTGLVDSPYRQAGGVMSSFVYPDPRWMHLPGDRAACGCHIERETGALVQCEACEEQAETQTPGTDWDAEVEALTDHFDRMVRWAS